jgi:alkylhydroperoxidase/carboxymuconolactone decarboxylase family protein YurZ
MTDLYPAEKIERGLDAMEKIYGKAVRDMSAAKLPAAQTQDTLGHLFADIWVRPQLSIRDRRLLVLGVTAMLGDAALVKNIVGGAILNEELDDEQLDEILLFLTYYIGQGKSQHLSRGIAEARMAAKAALPV